MSHAAQRMYAKEFPGKIHVTFFKFRTEPEQSCLSEKGKT